MKRASILLALLILSCARLPGIEPSDPGRLLAGAAPFPERPSRFVHAIEAAMARGKSSFLMGVTRVDPGEESIHCVLMTIEGLVMFEARFQGEMVVERAISPFDSAHFARGLMEDVRLIFFKPGGAPLISGNLEDGAPARRHETPDGNIVDVIARGENLWEIRQYKRRGAIRREVKIRMTATGDGESRMAAPAKIEL
ncbi:MAG: hypothetical protein GY859_38990, partial [Desulfobacterales bacterium]|nr:hypothetical protein [Desulfobacterales bacterium]